jgi:hypothetical protein
MEVGDAAFVRSRMLGPRVIKAERDTASTEHFCPRCWALLDSALVCASTRLLLDMLQPCGSTDVANTVPLEAPKKM